MSKVFLGGTCNDSNWRNKMSIHLYNNGIEYFNPVVDDWTEDCQEEELRQRENCDFCLYTITPKMTGVYSIAEVVDDSNKRPKKTILIILEDDDDDKWTDVQLRSLKSVAKMVKQNGGAFFRDLIDAAFYIKDQSLKNN